MELLSQIAMKFELNNSSIAGLTCAGVFFLLGVFIDGQIIRMSCWVYNMFWGGANGRAGVPMPDFLIASLTSLFGWLANLCLGIVFGPFGIGPILGTAITVLSYIPLSFIIASCVLSLMLPTTFQRALCAVLLHYMIGTAIGAVLFVSIFNLVSR